MDSAPLVGVRDLNETIVVDVVINQRGRLRLRVVCVTGDEFTSASSSNAALTRTNLRKRGGGQGNYGIYRDMHDMAGYMADVRAASVLCCNAHAIVT